MKVARLRRKILLPVVLLVVCGLLFSNLSARQTVVAETLPNYNSSTINREINIVPARVLAVTSRSSAAKDVSSKLKQEFGMIDWRAYMLDRYFEAKGSPLAGQGYYFILYCDLYGAPRDCTTIPAISYVETNYCKYEGTVGTHNCWGFGGSPPNRMKFGSYAEAIELITKRLVGSYGTNFLNNPRIGANTYCGHSNCGNWATAVEWARSDINKFSIEAGFGPIR
jgi:hypothetical protein